MTAPARTSPPIRTLPALLVNQIAAGEVIERPANVVKELIENAIDAGATRVDVAVEMGGKALVRVSDDGCGIPFDELVLAIAPHATSKIESASDLDAIATMGFRGEALASIASVSRLTLRSRPHGTESGGEIESEGGRTSGPRPAAGPPGTTLTVRNLFFNTPARRKFLKSDRAEAGRTAEVVRMLALANPAVAFRFSSDGQLRLDLPAQEPRRRTLEILGRELEPELLDITWDAPGVAIRGLAGTPHLARATTQHMRVFLNGRPIVDRTVHHAMREAYRGLIEPSKAPAAALFIEIDPAAVDVNVHPAKAEVRFRDSNVVHHAVLHALRRALEAAELAPRADLSRGGATSSDDRGAFVGHGRAAARETGAAAWPQRAGAKGFAYHELKDVLGETRPEALPGFDAARRAIQVHRSFIVTEDEAGLLIVDQHALHERILFERLLERLASGPLESQRLLLPATVRVERDRIEALESLAPLLERLGIEAAPVGPESIAVHAFTTLLFERGVDPVEFIEELLDRASRDQLAPEPEAALHEVLDMMACKAAVKAGDALEPAEIETLLRDRAKADRSSRCPHGRPTTIRLSIADLDRQFGRR